MRGCPPSAKPTAAPSARSCRCCANTSPPPVTSWSASTSTTGIPAPDWTAPAWTRCVMPPRPGSCERLWCLSPDRLARAYAYQVLVLDELDRFGVTVAFTDSPGAGRRRPASHPAHPGPGRDRRIRESQDRRTLPARQTVSGPRRRGRHLEGVLRLPAHSPQRRHRPSTPRGLRARGRGGAADLHRPRRGHHRARDLSPAQRRRDTVTDRQTHLGPFHDLPAAAQRGLRRPGLLQPHRIGARPPPHPPHPAGPARPGRMDPDRMPPDRLR